MINIQAKNKILTLYKGGLEAYKTVKQDEYKNLFYAVKSYMFSGNKDWVSAVGEFLCHGAMAFDRFIGARPAYVDDDSYNMFCSFLAALQKLDGNFYNRTYFFHLEKVKWQIFKECSLSPNNDEIKVLLNKCEEEIGKLILPRGEERFVKNLSNKRQEVVGLINDIRNGLVKTNIHTTLPFILTNSDATVDLRINGVKVKVKIANHSQGSTLPGTKVAEGSTLITSAPSKWTTTTCELDIEADCLLDGLQIRPSIALGEKEDDRYWNAAFDFTYQVISAIWIYTQQHENITGTWPPLPNDIHYISYQVISDGKVYDGEYSSNPALIYRFTSLNKSPLHYVINETSPGWSAYTYQFAKVYAKSGQLKESIFWLNVSVEALVEEFIRKVATSKEILAEIEGNEYKFDTAEEILVQQYPEMKGKVEWPNIIIHTSVFTKLKRAIQKSDKPHLQKDILKKYSQISAKRNALFHGDSVDINVEDVEKAFNAYDSLREKL